jgi:hypothetical protein
VELKIKFITILRVDKKESFIKNTLSKNINPHFILLIIKIINYDGKIKLW